MDNNWISVEDRLPQLFEEVLVYSVAGGIYINFVITDDSWNIPGCKITHWQPLPKPPHNNK